MFPKLEKGGSSADESQTFQLGALRKEEPDPERGYIESGISDEEGSDDDERDAPLLQSGSPEPTNVTRSSSDEGIRPAAWEKRASNTGLPSCLRPVWAWMQGPPHPRPYKITPLFESWQTAPGRIIDTYLPKRRQKAVLVLAVLLIWGFIFISVVDSTVRSEGVTEISCSRKLWCGVFLHAGTGIDANA